MVDVPVEPSEVIAKENRKVYDEKLKFTAGIDPYSVNGNFFLSF